MDMQNVSNLVIPEGEVRTIHDSTNRLIWGRLNYDTKYAGDSEQQTYTGKNLMPASNYDTALERLTYTPDLELLAGTYTISFIIESFELGTNTSFNLRLSLREANNTGHNIPIQTVDENTSIGSAKTTFTISYNAVKSGSTTIGIPQAIYDNGGRIKVSDIQIEAGSAATSYEPYTGGVPAPSPGYPQTINVVTGVQTITMSDGANINNYTVNLGSTELCKIGDHQDYIYKSGGDWYVHKETGRATLNGSETWNAGWLKTYSIRKANYMPNLYIPPKSINLFVNSFVPTSSESSILLGNVYAGGSFLNFNYDDVGDDAGLPAFQTWLSSHNIIIYAPLTSTTDTQITDATLVGQLDAIHQFLTRYGYSATVSGNLPLIIDKTNL